MRELHGEPTPVLAHLQQCMPALTGCMLRLCTHGATLAGVEVTLVDANHCPGAIQYIFKLPGGASYLHCGDMRFAPHLMDNPHLKAVRAATGVYLDTTYCNPKYLFPPQVCQSPPCCHSVFPAPLRAGHVAARLPLSSPMCVCTNLQA